MVLSSCVESLLGIRMSTKAGSFGSLEEGKEPVVRAKNQSGRHFPLGLLKFILILLGFGVVLSFISVYLSGHLMHNEVPMLLSRLTQTCAQERKNLFGWVRPPVNLWHEMNDTELFWRASFVPMIREYPYERTPKIAFMFLARGRLPMAPLWERFFKGHEKLYSIYIHSLPNYHPDFPPSSVFYSRHIPSQPVEWGRMSMCDAERRLLANALVDISNEWFVLLSESCIPIQNFGIVYRYLSRSWYSFMGSYDDPGPFGRGRYDKKMSPEVNLTDWRKGSQWFEVNRKLAIDIIKDTLYHPKFEKFCTPACYVDEHYFPTMLTIQSPRLLANRSLTWVDWSRGGAHPAMFGKGDINEELFKRIFYGEPCLYNQQPTKLCYLFARKFAPSALEPLLLHSSEFFGF